MFPTICVSKRIIFTATSPEVIISLFFGEKMPRKKLLLLYKQKKLTVTVSFFWTLSIV